MLEGPKVREVNFQESLENKDKRFDADFWVYIPVKNDALTYASIGEILLESRHGISIAMNEDGAGVPIYRRRA